MSCGLPGSLNSRACEAPGIGASSPHARHRRLLRASPGVGISCASCHLLDSSIESRACTACNSLLPEILVLSPLVFRMNLFYVPLPNRKIDQCRLRVKSNGLWGQLEPRLIASQ